MPTVEELDRARRLLDEGADSVRRLLRPVEAAVGPEVVSGGVLARSVGAVVAHRGADARALADELERLARECRALAATLAEV